MGARCPTYAHGIDAGLMLFRGIEEKTKGDQSATGLTCNADAYDRTCYNRNLNSTPYLMPNKEELLEQEIFALADVSRTVLSPLSQVHYRHGHHWS